jgi:hypothetical protein
MKDRNGEPVIAGVMATFEQVYDALNCERSALYVDADQGKVNKIMINE